MKFKLNALEKKWILYDVGNSAFTLLVSTIMPIYFNYLAGNAGVSDVDYLAYWGYAVSVSTVVVAILGPVLGTFSDFPGWKKKAWNISRSSSASAFCARIRMKKFSAAFSFRSKPAQPSCPYGFLRKTHATRNSVRIFWI